MKKLLLIALLIVGCEDESVNICVIKHQITSNPFYFCYSDISEAVCNASGEKENKYLKYHGNNYTCEEFCDTKIEDGYLWEGITEDGYSCREVYNKELL